MADYAKINGVGAADIVKIDGVAIASVAKVNGTDKPSTTATYWVAGLTNGRAAYTHASSSLETWEGWLRSSGSPRAYDIAYGHNNNGDGVFAIVNNSSDKEVEVSSTDITDLSTAWTAVNLDGNTQRSQYVINWAASSSAANTGVWMSIGTGAGQYIFRSIDGAQNWSAISLNTGMGFDNGRGVQGLSSDGGGKWAFAQKSRFFYSSTDGATWASSQPWSSGGTPGQCRACIWTNNSWVVIYSRSQQIYVRSCADSDITDWGTEFRPSISYNKNEADGSGTATNTIYALNPDNTNEKRASTAAANGRVVFATTNDDAVFYFDVNGKTISNGGGVYFDSHVTYEGVTGWHDSNTMQDIATDGTTWVLTCKNGDAYKSTNNGEAWTQIVDAFADSPVVNTDDWYAITCNVTLPL